MTRPGAVRSLAVLLAWAAVSVAAPAAGRPTATVDRVEWSTTPGGARVTVQVGGGQVRWSGGRAGASPADGLPERAFVDIRPAELSPTLTRAPVVIEKGLLRRVRVGQNDPETVRVAIELTGPAAVEIRAEKSPPRIVVDLKTDRGGERPAISVPAVTPPVARTASPIATPTPAPAPTPTPTAWMPPSPTPTWPPLAPPTAPATFATPTASPPRWLATPTPPAPPPPSPIPTAWLPPTPTPSPAAPWAYGTPAATGAPSPTPGPAADWREMYGGAATVTPTPPALDAAAAERLLPPTLPQETAAPRARGHRVVVLDPGHGGKDPGARGLSDVEEKRITLAVARLAAARLRRLDPTLRVLLTRGGDSYVALADRTAFANAKGADLFVSIHVNAAENADSSGIETYTLNNSNDRATKRLAALENGLSETGVERDDKDLAWIVSDLLQTGKEGESIALAESLQRETLRSVRRRWADTEGLGVKKGPFFVLVGAYMPCALVETGFLTHPKEATRLSTQAYQEALADGIARGVLAFLSSGEANSNL